MCPGLAGPRSAEPTDEIRHAWSDGATRSGGTRPPMSFSRSPGARECPSTSISAMSSSRSRPNGSPRRPRSARGRCRRPVFPSSSAESRHRRPSRGPSSGSRWCPRALREGPQRKNHPLRALRGARLGQIALSEGCFGARPAPKPVSEGMSRRSARGKFGLRYRFFRLGSGNFTLGYRFDVLGVFPKWCPRPPPPARRRQNQRRPPPRDGRPPPFPAPNVEISAAFPLARPSLFSVASEAFVIARCEARPPKTEKKSWTRPR